MCKKLDIRRSSYYKWLDRPVPENEQENIRLSKIIMGYHQRYGGILGYRRMRLFINRDNDKHYNTKRIHRIMNILGIRSTIRRTRTCCTVSNRTDQKAENLLHREFKASRPNEKWTTDVTEFKVLHSAEKIYLSAFLDLYDRSIIAWSISNRNEIALVLDTFDQAIKQNPDGKKIQINSRTTAKLIKKLPGYKKGQSIRLLSCSTGSKTKGFAQDLANKLNVKVYAPSDILWVYPSGKIVVAPRNKKGDGPDLSKRGGFIEFRPGGNKKMIECPVCGSRLVEAQCGSSVEIKCTKCNYSVVTTNISLIYEDETIYDVYLLKGNIINKKVITLAKSDLNVNTSEALKLVKNDDDIKLYSGNAVEIKSLKEKLDDLNLKYKITPEFNW